MSVPQSLRLLAADSFRVRKNPVTGEAEARAVQRHVERFQRAVRDALHGSADSGSDTAHTDALVREFVRTAAAQIREFGEGWPRLELWGVADGFQHQPDLRVTLRALPEMGDTLELRTWGRFDTEWPERKGPNISDYAALGRELAAEAMLLDDRGRVIEGATTSLLWWHDGRLHRIAPGGRVPSITESLVAEIALADYATVSADALPGNARPRVALDRAIVAPAISPSELAGHETWAVNALHGIRLVTRIDGVEPPAPDLARWQWFCDRLDQMWEPVTNMRAV